MADQGRVEQIVSEFVSKAAFVVLQSRVPGFGRSEGSDKPAGAAGRVNRCVGAAAEAQLGTRGRHLGRGRVPLASRSERRSERSERARLSPRPRLSAPYQRGRNWRTLLPERAATLVPVVFFFSPEADVLDRRFLCPLLCPSAGSTWRRPSPSRRASR